MSLNLFWCRCVGCGGVDGNVGQGGDDSGGCFIETVTFGSDGVE